MSPATPKDPRDAEEAEDVIGELIGRMAGDLDGPTASSPEVKAAVEELRSLDPTDAVATPQSDGPVPGLRHLPTVIERARAEPRESLVQSALAAVGVAAWTTFYAESEWSAGFIDDFAVGVLVGPDGPHISRSVVVGLLLLGPHTSYPLHAHPAVEVYRLLSGGGEFFAGAAGEFQRRQPGSVVVHRANEPHAIRTGHSPLLALYVWIGDLTGRIWYRDGTTDPESEVYPLMAIESAWSE